METTTQRTEKYTVVLDAEDAEWAKYQPGGLSEQIRRLLKEARDAEEKLIAEEDALWDASTARPGFVEKLNEMAAKARADRKAGKTFPLEVIFEDDSDEDAAKSEETTVVE